MPKSSNLDWRSCYIILIYLRNKSMEFSDIRITYKSNNFRLCGILSDSYFLINNIYLKELFA